MGTTGPRRGALISRRWEAHKHFLYQEPGGVQAKGVARKGKLPRAPGAFSVSTADRAPFIRFTELASAGPFYRLEEVHLSCLSKGRGSLGDCGHHRVTLIRDVKGDVGNLLLLPTLSSLRRRLQVEKSPVGTATELSAPEYLQEGNVLRRPGSRHPGSQGHR